MKSENDYLSSRLSRTPGARLDVACSRLGACDISGSSSHCHAGIDEGRSATRVCCLVDGARKLSQEAHTHMFKGV